jgi:alpha-L-arabinofuranosidase
MKVCLANIYRAITCIVFAWLFAAPGALRAATAAIDIDLNQRGPALNPQMYGIFLEEINHGVDGGLYAELIRNRGFEDAKPPEGFNYRDGRWVTPAGYDAGFDRFGYFTNGIPFWTLLQENGARGSMNLDLTHPLNPATPRSLRLEIETPGADGLSIANQGFWGIGAVANKKYHLSFWARANPNFSGPITATLSSSEGHPLSHAVAFSGLTPEWRHFEDTLAADETDGHARLLLTAHSAGTIWFDMVSLFPADTFRGRPNGLRADIAQMIADLHPGFVRFPGGCVVEGGSLETSYNWRKTIGPLEQREEVWGPWNYRRTHGMGFYEYLQFCEDIGAAPLFVGFAGETCLFRNVQDVPMSDMGSVATNFLDALEFANGDTSNPFGRLRAEEGHPASFGIKLVEVGNEGGTTNFPPRYQIVHSLLKSNFPAISYINDLSFQRRDWVKSGASALEDNHFYNSPQWFMNNTRHYDNRDRSLPPVYDGEVAVTSGEGGRDKGNLIAALAEGAFLMGLERNADVVRMVSYAPLLANIEGRTDWHGMIYFDSLRSYGTVSYYLWKLFGLNRPDHTVETSVNYTPDDPGPITGGIGVGTWGTSAEFKDIRVEKNGQTLYASDFSSQAANWKSEGGNWSVVNGAWRQSDQAEALSYFGDDSWTNYTLTLQAKKIIGPEGFLIVFGHKNSDKFWWNLGGWGNHDHAIEFNQTDVGPHVRGHIETDRWYAIKIQIAGRHIQCFLDGQLIHDVAAPARDRFFAEAGRDDKPGDIIVKAINVSAQPVQGQIALKGASQIQAGAKVVTLSSTRLSDNNSLDQPEKVMPVEAPANLSGDHFTWQFPANSLTILRLPLTKSN